MKTTKFDKVAQFERVSSNLVDEARQFQSAVLCDVAGRRGALHARIQGLSPTMKLAGPAFPVEVRPGDNLLFHVVVLKLNTITCSSKIYIFPYELPQPFGLII